MTFKMYDANLDQVGDVWRQTGGVNSGSVLVPMLLPGNYFLSVTGGSFADGGQWQSQDPPTNRPDHFQTPYEFRLSVP
jgi:hypothetical protein